MDGEGVAHLLADVGPPDGAHSLEHGVIGAGAIAWAPQLVAEGRVDAFAVVAAGGDLHALYGSGGQVFYTPTGALLVAFVDMDGHLWVGLQGRDGADQNCDGIDGVDVDGDGHATTATGGDDCFDDDPEAWACGGS